MDDDFSDEEHKSPKAVNLREILNICGERERIDVEHLNVLQAFTYGKRLQYGGQPNRDEIVKLQSRYP